jgi:hypothetical protein
MDQDITPFNKSQKMEHFDDEGKKYLSYKAISGMDCVPRLRQPTPPMGNAREELDRDDHDPTCKNCQKHSNAYNNLLEENGEIKQELENLRSQINQMRRMQKANNLRSAQKMERVGESRPFVTN